MFFFKKETQQTKETEEVKEETETVTDPRKEVEKVAENAGIDLTQYPIYFDKKVTDEACAGMYQENGQYIGYYVDRNGKYVELKSRADARNAYLSLCYTIGMYLVDYYHLGRSYDPHLVFLTEDEFMNNYKQLLGITDIHVNYEMDSMYDFELSQKYAYLKQNPKLLLEAKYFVCNRDFVPNPHATKLDNLTVESIHSRMRDAYGRERFGYLDSFGIMVTLRKRGKAVANRLDGLLNQMYGVVHANGTCDPDAFNKVDKEIYHLIVKRDD